LHQRKVLWIASHLFSIFIFTSARVTHKAFPYRECEPWVTDEGPMAFLFEAIGATLWLFCFSLNLGNIEDIERSMEDGHFGESEERIGGRLLGEADV